MEEAAVCVSQLGLWAGEERQGAVGVRGRPEDLLEGGVRLLPAGPYGGQSPDSRVLHPRQSEERHWPPADGHHRLWQRHRDRIHLLSGWEALYCIWLTSYLTSLVVIWQYDGISEILGWAGLLKTSCPPSKSCWGIAHARANIRGQAGATPRCLYFAGQQIFSSTHQ